MSGHCLSLIDFVTWPIYFTVYSGFPLGCEYIIVSAAVEANPSLSESDVIIINFGVVRGFEFELGAFSGYLARNAV